MPLALTPAYPGGALLTPRKRMPHTPLVTPPSLKRNGYRNLYPLLADKKLLTARSVPKALPLPAPDIATPIGFSAIPQPLNQAEGSESSSTNNELADEAEHAVPVAPVTYPPAMIAEGPPGWRDFKESNVQNFCGITKIQFDHMKDFATAYAEENLNCTLSWEPQSERRRAQALTKLADTFDYRALKMYTDKWLGKYVFMRVMKNFVSKEKAKAEREERARAAAERQAAALREEQAAAKKRALRASRR